MTDLAEDDDDDDLTDLFRSGPSHFLGRPPSPFAPSFRATRSVAPIAPVYLNCAGYLTLPGPHCAHDPDLSGDEAEYIENDPDDPHPYPGRGHALHCGRWGAHRPCTRCTPSNPDAYRQEMQDTYDNLPRESARMVQMLLREGLRFTVAVGMARQKMRRNRVELRRAEEEWAAAAAERQATRLRRREERMRRAAVAEEERERVRGDRDLDGRLERELRAAGISDRGSEEGQIGGGAVVESETVESSEGILGVGQTLPTVEETGIQAAVEPATETVQSRMIGMLLGFEASSFEVACEEASSEQTLSEEASSEEEEPEADVQDDGPNPPM